MQNKERINLRTTQEKKKYIAMAAAYSGTSLSSFLLESAEQRAKEVIEAQTRLQLSVKDWNAFAEILDETDIKDRPNLKALVREHADELS